MRGSGAEGLGGSEEGAFTSGSRVAATLVLGLLTHVRRCPWRLKRNLRGHQREPLGIVRRGAAW